ncbi:response regulator transcription factor [Saccharibacillus sp. CPCC 101409]|uniref:response regulator transcription factor n=1 Tax=Saccharibacillus sp. CPCC 101409 TaxID=3058041 RepID=UPI002673BBE4|nr:response regulator transcription factor [Saccharibacillus sp. CPCC 101409]MDO3411035.1 response regulator transcription factor [Saccharibacillus sp. CPCC 101409]
MSYTLLIADDERDIRDMLASYFGKCGYEVLLAEGGREAVRIALRGPDLILLDVGMPDMDGLEVCRSLRDAVSCPILFLTARIEDADKVNGFAAGGDDYIVKPFSLSELAARVAAHLRREERQTAKAEVKFAGGLVINYSAAEIAYRGAPVPLTRQEYRIAELLSLHAGRVFDKEAIYEKIWGREGEGSSAVVAEHVRKLRGKLAEAGADSPIETIWGLGYKWRS